SDMGPVGIKLDGGGQLRDGFSGELAAVAPDLAVGGCQAKRASLYGKVTVRGEKPRFVGPLRLAALDCASTGLAMKAAGVEIDATADQPLDGGEGKLALRTGLLALGENRVRAANGTARFTFRKQALTA